MDKVNILITSPAHTFAESMLLVVSKLILNHNVFVILVDNIENSAVSLKLDDLGLISYIIIPNNIPAQYAILERNLNELKAYKFNIWISISNIQPFEKFIQKFIIPEDSVKIILWTGQTFLFMRPDLVSSLQANNHNYESLTLERDGVSSFMKKVFDIVLKINIRTVNRKIKFLWNNKIKKYVLGRYNRIILPWVKYRTTFDYSEIENVTQMTSGNIDIILLTDKFEVDMHKMIYKKYQTVVQHIQHPSVGNCRCTTIGASSKIILSPLSGISGVDDVPEIWKNEYLKGLSICLRETDANMVHLRLHPRETGLWPFKLRDYLIKNGIPVKLVSSRSPIRDIICDYIGIVGFSSCSLRDARASCDYAFVVCFEGLSKIRFQSPKLLYGHGCGIDWIDEKCGYNPIIFKRKKYHRADKITVDEVVEGCIHNNLKIK